MTDAAFALDPFAVQHAALLKHLAETPEDGWTVGALAVAIGRDPSNLRKSVDKLEDLGFAAFNSLHNGLTDAGLAQLDAIRRAERASDEPGLPGGPRWPEQVGDIRMLLHAQIFPDPANARSDWDSDDAREQLDALREDIVQAGLLQNLIVRPMTDAERAEAASDRVASDSAYILVGGERRWRAIGLAIAEDDWPADRPLPCRVVDVDELGHRLAALSENLQRRDLNPLEKARAFAGLARAFADAGVDEDKVNREIADRVGVTIEHVQQHRAFLRLSDEDQHRLTLPRDDARRLSISEARKLVSAMNQAEAARRALDEAPVLERLAFAEVMHAVAARGRYSYDDVVVRGGAAETPVGLALQALGWIRFSGPCTYGDHLGHQVVARAPAAPSALAGPFWVDDTQSRDAALRAVQAQAGFPDREDYVTEWLNPPFDLTPEGQAVIDAAREQSESRAAAEAARDVEGVAAQAERDAVEQRQRQLAQRSRDLFAAWRTSPELPAPEVTQLATDAEARLPWRLRFDASVLDADGRIVIGAGSGGATEARMRLLVLAVNAAAGLQTPEDEPDANPTLDQDAFVAAIAAALPDGDAEHAAGILSDFLTDNAVDFGEDGWDWTAEGARILATNDDDEGSL